MLSSQIKARSCCACFILATVCLVGRIEPLCAQTASNPDPPKSEVSAIESAGMSKHKTQEAARYSPPLAAKETRDARIFADTQQLIELAEELKAEVAKSTKDTLSLGVIKKASEVEKQAHSLKEQMKHQK